jgi:hypothetical protein
MKRRVILCTRAGNHCLFPSPDPVDCSIVSWSQVNCVNTTIHRGFLSRRGTGGYFFNWMSGVGNKSSSSRTGRESGSLANTHTGENVKVTRRNTKHGWAVAFHEWITEILSPPSSFFYMSDVWCVRKQTQAHVFANLSVTWLMNNLKYCFSLSPKHQSIILFFIDERGMRYSYEVKVLAAAKSE